MTIGHIHNDQCHFKKSKMTRSCSITVTSTDDYENKWNHNYHNYHNLPSGCSLLPLHDQLSSPEEKEKKNTNLSFIPKKNLKKRKKFTYQSQVKFLF